MKYREFREYWQKEFEKLPVKYAFNQKQLEKAMNELGLDVKTDMDKVISIFGAGDIWRKDDVEKYNEFSRKESEQRNELMKDKEFVKDMFLYEMGNHEYGYTLDSQDVIEACGLTMTEVLNNEFLHGIWDEARKEFFKSEE